MQRTCIWVVAFLAALVLCAGVTESRAEDGRVEIFYTGNTLGKYHACPTCGRYGLGGLSRRAHVFGEMREQAEPDSTLFIAGGYEFTPFKTAPGSEREARALGTAYEMLGYDAGFLSAKDADWLKAAGVGLPEVWRTAEPSATSMVLTRGGKRFGIVFFPASEDGYKLPAKGVVDAAASALDALRGEVDVLIGVSSWGVLGEMDFLQRYEGAVDMLLGSGPGRGFGPRLQPGGTLWLRPEFEGRSILKVVLSPGAVTGDSVLWGEKQLVDISVIVLDDDVPFDAKMAEVFAWL